MEKNWVKGRERGVRKKEGEIWWGGVEGGAVGRATQTNEENEEVELSNSSSFCYKWEMYLWTARLFL